MCREVEVSGWAVTLTAEHQTNRLFWYADQNRAVRFLVFQVVQTVLGMQLAVYISRASFDFESSDMLRDSAVNLLPGTSEGADEFKGLHYRRPCPLISLSLSLSL